MNPRNLVEALAPIGLKLGFLVPTIEAKFVDGKEPILSVRGQSVRELNDHLFYAVVALEKMKVEPKNGNVVYTAGYTISFKDKHSSLLIRKELGNNPDGGLEMAWAFLGEVQESGHG